MYPIRGLPGWHIGSLSSAIAVLLSRPLRLNVSDPPHVIPGRQSAKSVRPTDGQAC